MKKNDIITVNINGFEFKYDPDVLDDVRVLSLVDEAQKSNTKLIDLVKFIMSEESYNEMNDYFVKKEGKLRLSTLKDVFEKTVGANPNL